MINQHLDKVSPAARAAWARIQKKDGKVRKTAPSWRTDPHAWAAWQALRTSYGQHGESATFTLLMIPMDARNTWDELSTLITACRDAIRRGRVTFTLETPRSAP